MKYKDRLGNLTDKADFQEKLIDALYSHSLGRMILKPATAPSVSRFCSSFLNSKASTIFIKPFIKSNSINMNDYEDREFVSYNDFFTRKIKEGKRTFDMSPSSLVSPSDGKVTVYEIKDNLTFKIKNTVYNVESLLSNKELAQKFNNGYSIVIRLSVDNYHRYCYIDDALKSPNVFIKGKLHTVNPIAFEYAEVFKENSREYCVLDTKNFGKIVQLEVGALMVGKIVNYHDCKQVSRGEEKGRFEFGGSTIVLLVQENKVSIDADILQNSADGFETVVFLGEKIGTAKNI